MDTPIDEKRVPWDRAVFLSWVPSMRWTDTSGAPVDAYPDLEVRFVPSRAGAVKLFTGSPVSLEQTFSNSAAGKARSNEYVVFTAHLDAATSTRS